jgi:hypothetical protein
MHGNWTSLDGLVRGRGVESSDGSIGVRAPGEIVAVFVIGH